MAHANARRSLHEWSMYGNIKQKNVLVLGRMCFSPLSKHNTVCDQIVGAWSAQLCNSAFTHWSAAVCLSEKFRIQKQREREREKMAHAYMSQSEFWTEIEQQAVHSIQ